MTHTRFAFVAAVLLALAGCANPQAFFPEGNEPVATTQVAAMTNSGLTVQRTVTMKESGRNATRSLEVPLFNNLHAPRGVWGRVSCGATPNGLFVGSTGCSVTRTRIEPDANVSELVEVTFVPVGSLTAADALVRYAESLQDTTYQSWLRFNSAVVPKKETTTILLVEEFGYLAVRARMTAKYENENYHEVIVVALPGGTLLAMTWRSAKVSPELSSRVMATVEAIVEQSRPFAGR